MRDESLTAGCCGVCQGYQGAQTLPREVTIDLESRALIMYPVQEVALLRSKALYNNSAILLPSNGSQVRPKDVDFLPHLFPGCKYHAVAV